MSGIDVPQATVEWIIDLVDLLQTEERGLPVAIIKAGLEQAGNELQGLVDQRERATAEVTQLLAAHAQAFGGVVLTPWAGAVPLGPPEGMSTIRTHGR